MTLLFIYLFLAVGISFLCSILESVLLSTSKFYIDAQVQLKSHGAKLLKRNSDEIELSISSILTLNTFAHTLGAAGVGAQAMLLFGEEYMFLISAVLTLVILYVSEIIPKTIGALYWKDLAVPSAFLIRFMINITYPLIKISSFITKLFTREKVQKISIAEIKAMADQGEKDGLLNEREGGIIDNIFDLKRLKVKDILTPRSVIFAQNENMSVDEFLEQREFETFSRVPLYKNDLDDIEQVVLLRKILTEKISGSGKKSLKLLATDIFTINENIPISKALEEFIKRKEHIFLVKDKYSQTQGLVTLEDAIEALLGVEIVDEYDSEEDMQLFAKLQKRQRDRK
ncbi:MAG: CNNM domain-containing protein [Campylobacterota bacterium]|nr:CNNM domain-containing protein [Campylobacterota bacterium]